MLRMKGGLLAAVTAGLAIGVCVGIVLLAQQGSRVPVELSYADPEYIDWLDSAGLAEGLTPTNPVELPLGMYQPAARCSRPPCGCCGDPYQFVVDPADTPSPEQEVIDNYKMPADEVNLYKQAWNRFDGKRGGRIPTRMPNGETDLRPLAKLVRTLGTNPQDTDLQYTLGQVDPQGSGIDYPNFLLTMARHAPAWPVAVSESLSIPMSVKGMNDPTTRSRFRKAIAGAADVLPSKVSIVRVRPGPGGQGSIVDMNVDASTDDMELMKKVLTTETINQNLARFGLPGISKGPEIARGVESITLPQSAASITPSQQEAMKAAIAGIITGALMEAGRTPGPQEVSIVRIQGVNGRPEEASIDIGVEAENEGEFGLVQRALQPSVINSAFEAAGLLTPTSSSMVALPSGFTPGCMRCGGTSPYVDGDDLGKDWVGNSPFDKPLSRYQSEEVHRFDSDKPICQCDDDRR